MSENFEIFLFGSLGIFMGLTCIKFLFNVIFSEYKLDAFLGRGYFYNDLEGVSSIIYIILAILSILSIIVNIVCYLEILKISYYSFVKLFSVFAFFATFWGYLIIGSFNDLLGFWGLITKGFIVYTLAGYIKDVYSSSIISLGFVILGIPFLIYCIIGFMKLGACYSNPQGRTNAIMQFFYGLINTLVIAFFAFSPIIHSKILF